MPLDSPSSYDLARYARQTRFPPLGDGGQRRLGQGQALLCGCGALGSAIANILVRAGVGMLRIVDRDFVELTNLQRQSLFDEADAAAGTPKAIAAAEKLRAVNSMVSIEPIVADIDPENIGRFCEGIHVILDGTDNFETRFLINDLAVSRGLPWVYGGCVGAEGQSMTILPGETPCLGCLMPECPAPGSVPTCETAGIVGPIVGLIASIEAVEALKLLSGNRAAISRSLTVVDLWPGTKPMFRQIDVRGLRERVDCPTCRRGVFPWLSGRLSSRTVVLCGRNAVQLSHPGASLPLDQLAARLEGVAQILARNQFLLRLRIEGYELTLFPDARAIISGTDDPAVARDGLRKVRRQLRTMRRRRRSNTTFATRCQRFRVPPSAAHGMRLPLVTDHALSGRATPSSSLGTVKPRTSLQAARNARANAKSAFGSPQVSGIKVSNNGKGLSFRQISRGVKNATPISNGAKSFSMRAIALIWRRSHKAPLGNAPTARPCPNP